MGWVVGVGIYSPPHEECLEIRLVVIVLSKYAQFQHAAELFSLVQALQSWGPGKLRFILQSDYVMPWGGDMQQRKQQQWLTPKGPLSNVDLWMQLLVPLKWDSSELHADDRVLVEEIWE